ncbi:hypothetical protein [Bacteroides sp. 519]|uniref:hypothetical protein n=1 Tax=Bacteroides sp. 519 TaxID=2302937 RepID=UPI001940390B|nr:hypothetical protein [Bacteroides sp. 519]NDV59678.1 hypothetical protein [Bacteroides sp. 519]
MNNNMKRLSIFLLWLMNSYFCVSQVDFIRFLEELSPKEVVISSKINQKSNTYFDLIQKKVSFKHQADSLESLFVYINENERFSIYHMFCPDLFQKDKSDINYVYIGLYDKATIRFYLIKYHLKGYYTYSNRIRKNKYCLNINLPPRITSIIELDNNLVPIAAISFSLVSGIPIGNLGFIDGFFKFNIQDSNVLMKEILPPYNLKVKTDTYNQIAELLSWIKHQNYLKADCIQNTPIFSLELGKYIEKAIFDAHDYIFLTITPDIKKINRSLHWHIVELFKYCMKHKYDFYWLTASSAAEIDKWKNINKIQYPFRHFIPSFEDALPEYPFIEKPFYLVDEQILKKQISSEYGVLIIKNGIILERWDGCLDKKIDFPFSKQKEIKTNLKALFYELEPLSWYFFPD